MKTKYVIKKDSNYLTYDAPFTKDISRAIIFESREIAKTYIMSEAEKVVKVALEVKEVE